MTNESAGKAHHNSHVLFLANVLGSASAGIIARIFTHPLDTAKARVQAVYSVASSGSQTAAVTSPYRGPLDVLKKTFRAEGMSGLYRGFGAVVIGGTPGTVLYLTSYDLAKEQLTTWVSNASSHPPERQSTSVATDFAIHFSSGMFAEAVACVVYVPVDVIKERLQVQHASDNSAYRGSMDAIRTIARTEGILALYKGYGATLLSFGSYSGLFFLFYEQMLAQIRRYLYPNNDISSYSRDVPFQYTLLSSCAAGALASWLTSPLDMAKLRLQVQRGQQKQQPAGKQSVLYKGVWDCLAQSYRQGGWKGLFRGAGARVLHFAPATTVTITSYEVCRSFFAKSLAVDG